MMKRFPELEEPLLDMPHAAYRAACRVRNYAEWVSWSSLLCADFSGVLDSMGQLPLGIVRRSYSALRKARSRSSGRKRPGSDVRRCGPSECRFLQGQVSVQVDLCRVHRLVPEPEGDHGRVHAGGEQLHGGAVPQDVRRDASCL